MSNNHIRQIDFSEVNNKIFENAAVILALVNDQGHIVNINKAGVGMVGKQKADILHKAGGEVFNCSNAWSRGKMVCGIGKNCPNCSIRTTVMKTFETGEPIFKKEGHLDVDMGSSTMRLQLLISTDLLSISDQNFVLLTIEDITELKNKETNLREAILTKERFFSIIYNDLRGPISSVMAFTKLMSEDVVENNPNDCQENFSLIHDEMESTFKLLENLLLWSRNQHGKIRINPSLVQVKKMANEVTSLFSKASELKSIEIINNIPDNLIIKVDKDMFSSVLRNLLSNAIKFSKPDSTIKVNAAVKADAVEMSVVDEGIGMSESELAQLFDIHKEPPKRETANEKGTGIGLILCKEFIEKHQGKLWVESKINEGTSVNFTLPTLINKSFSQSVFVD